MNNVRSTLDPAAAQGTAPETGPGPEAPETRPSLPAHRLGPRPLAFHLSAAALAWTSSLAAWPFWRNGSLPWRPEVREAAAALRAPLAAADPDAFAEALNGRARDRALALIDGIMAYRRHPYRRDLPTPSTVWSEGTTRLLDYGADPASDPADQTPLLVVPSLINRAYILDLNAEISLMRWLAAQGFRPYLVEWDRPGPTERRFTLTDYIAGRLEGALDVVHAKTRQRPLLLGYCMGGLLALSLAVRRPQDFAGLALLATPWDFHAESDAQGALAAAAALAFAPALDAFGELPVDAIQALFAAIDPLMVARKFINFGKLDPNGPKAAMFVALEDWLNDGVPLAAAVARECLIGWYAENTPATGTWRVAGRPVDPGALDLPTLCLIPATDRIVPPASAAALGAAIPGAISLTPTIGHIGMVVSRGARERVWHPLADWLRAHAPATGTRPGKVKKSSP